MATKLQIITAIYEDEIKNITKSYDNWTSFLRTAANNYKYSFPEQLLIYAQKPYATACAEIGLWNEKFDRWVNRGATGIALFDYKGSYQKLRYVFDVSDTNSRNGIEVPIWQMKPKYEQDVAEALTNAFGEPMSNGDLAWIIEETAKNMVADHSVDYLSSLSDVTNGSFLEELDELNTKKFFEDTLAASIGYMMMCRCGINPENHYVLEDFEKLYSFNTHDTVTALGSAVSDIAEMGLREIESTVWQLQKNEKKLNRTFVKAQENDYDKGAIENIQPERSKDYVTDNLQTGGRLSDTQHHLAERGEQFTWKVWDDEKGLSDEPQKGDVQHSFDKGRTDEAPQGSGSTSREDDGAVDITDGTRTGRERADERNQSALVGADDEQHSALSRGNGTQRLDLQLSNHNFNGGNWNGIEYFHQNKEKNELIHEYLSSHREEIASFYESHSDSKERSNFIMSFFNSEPFEITLSNGVKAGFEAYSDAIYLWRGDKEHPERECWERWHQVSSAVYGMILLEQWTEPEALQLPSVDNQLEFIGDKVKDGVLPLPQAAIDYVLGTGSRFSEGKFRTYQHFSEFHTRDENIAFLKNEYGMGGGTDAIPGSGYWESHDSKGIEISDHYSVPERRILLKWNEVSKRLTELIKLDRYLSPKEKEMYPQWLENKLIKEAEWKKSNEIRQFINTAPEEEQAAKEYRYDFHLGDTVYIGADEYTIVSLEEPVILNDSQYPLFNKEFSKADFENKVKENPANEHLRVEVEVERPITDNELQTEVDESNKPDFLIQYEQVKKENPDGVLLMHTGGFYFAFGDDAKIITKYTHHTAPKKNFYGNVFTPCCQVLDFNLSYCQKELCENNNINIVIMEFDKGVVDRIPTPSVDISETFDVDYTDAFFVNDGSNNVEWVYFNPDGNDGKGQFVNNLITYDDILKAKELYSDEEKFFDYLGSVAKQTLSDYGTKEYKDDYEYFHSAVDLTDCTKETMKSLIAEAEEGFAQGKSQDEIMTEREVLYAVLDKLNINDIELSYKGDILYATDGDNEWNGNEIYEFLIDEAFVFNDDGSVLGIDEALLEKFKVNAELNGVKFKDNRYNPLYRGYLAVKNEEPDKIVLYQVGDFFEAFNDDAKTVAEALDLTLTSRPISDTERATLVGFPKHSLETYLNMLTDRGHDIVLLSVENDERKETTIISTNKEDPVESKPVGRIDYLSTNGKVRESIEYTSEYQFVKDIKDENYYGVPMSIYVYADKDGKTIDRSFVSSLDPPPLGFKVIPSPYLQIDERSDVDDSFDDINPAVIRENLAERGIVNGEVVDEEALNNSPFVQKVMSDVENITQQEKAATVPNRFLIRLLPNEGGITGIWDASLDRFCEDNNQILRFAEQKNAIDYLAEIQRSNGMEVTEPLFTTPLGNIYKVGDGISSSGTGHTEVTIVIERVDEDDIWYTLPSRPEQEAVNIDRNSFERYLDTGYFAVVINEPLVRDEDIIGKEITIDGSKFKIERYDRISGDVSMLDLSSIYPINRVEKIDYVRQFLDKEPSYTTEITDVFPAEENGMPFDVVFQTLKTNEPKEKVTTLKPDVPESEKHDFKITDDNLGVGGAKEKFKNNMAAINLLHELEFDDRLATPEEQEILSKYVGFGGLADAFDESKDNWKNEFTELYTTLSPEEYASARESTLTAFYTPPVVIRSMYQALENMGFTNGNILEPSCGVGNFIGLKPDSMKDSKIYGVELDTLTGGIAQQLYQKSNIAVQGYEQTNLPDSFFDVAIGNVPFGQFKVSDKKYDKNNWLIHDYFFGKTLDKVRPGGVIAFITSSGTMDKRNSNVRRYIAQRAELLGAIRLPNNTFKANAGTEVVSDILFLQKRDTLVNDEPDWVYVGQDENGLELNQYFINNPDMVLGELAMESSPYGPSLTCKPYENADLSDLLNDAIQNIHAEIKDFEIERDEAAEEDLSVPADPTVKNFSFTVREGIIYYRQNSRMNPVNVSATAENRIKGMIEIRDCVRQLIALQTDDYPDSAIKSAQERLNTLYDTFTKKYGLLNARANKLVFADDSSYCLLCSLEVIGENGELKRKADMFSKRTIKPHIKVTAVDTPSEALAVSIGEKAYVDMEYMSELTGKTEQELFEALKGVIFLNPLYEYGNHPEGKYLMADEYLSGNVREKLAVARKSAELYPDDYSVNVEALEKVQPQELTASEISVRLGATWLPESDIQKFIFELLQTPRYVQWNVKVHYSKYTAEWNIENKSYDRTNVIANSTYGTDRMNAYKIIEETLNLKDVRIFDYVEDEHGNKKPVLNKKDTAIAQGKQELIKQAFQDWIWNNPERRQRLVKLYNEKFNSMRAREYDGSHIKFSGMNPEITLRPHQVNAVARIMYGGNTLLAHVVGAGKTFEMIAAAQESKRLGLCNKSLIVVPNHLTEQWASEYLQLYPSANILVATKKDFETKNRKKFCARIATGDYDAIIIGHSQFEKIPLSFSRQRAMLQAQLDEITDGIKEIKHNRGERFTVKQLEKTKKSLQGKLDKLNDQSRKDDVVTFEELGVDRLFVDEAHSFKNLYLYTKMRNVGGIAQTEAQKSSDLYMKCRYLDEITDSKGTIFATGTPVSNSMVELYTMQRYLQYETLKDKNLQHFDAWASTFGETVTAIELAPEGTGYRAKTRFAKFYNLPELMMMFRQIADIQTADMLKLPVPEAIRKNIAIEPSEMQKEIVASLAERAEKVRNKMVDASIDNMLLITNDGRKLALDQRLTNEMLPDDPNGKVAVCANNVYDVWEKTQGQKSTQLVFCDLSTPHNDGKFNVYDDLKKKLLAKGIPESEIAFIHSAETEAKKKDLFSKVRSGQVRVLIGSTFKMGAGTNVQQKLIAEHHLDCPWRPADLQQREGRIIRQGNENPQVEIYTYVTKETFDSYLYQLVENKQKFIGQIMTSKSPVRSAEDVDEQALSYAEIKALATGNPYIKEKMDLDVAVSKLKLLKQNHLSQRYALEDKLSTFFPAEVKRIESRVYGYENDIARVKDNTILGADDFSTMVVEGVSYTEKKAAGTAILVACKAMTSPEPKFIGSYRGLDMELSFNNFEKEYVLTLVGELRHSTPLGPDILGNITRIDNLISKFPERLEMTKEKLTDTHNQMKNAQEQVEKPFPQEDELTQKSERLAELNSLLDMNHTDNEIVDGERETDDIAERTNERVYAR